MNNLKNKQLLREVIMYRDEDEEIREFVENQEHKDTIFAEFEDVEVLTVKECIEHGIGYPSFDLDILECNTCGIEGCWDEGTGTSNGNMFYCEKCHDYVCHKCLEENGVINESILCKHCINRLNIKPSLLISLSNAYNITELKALNKIEQEKIKIFQNTKDYIDWMYGDLEAKRDFFNSIIYSPLNTGSNTVADCLISGDSRVARLEDGLIGFYFR